MVGVVIADSTWTRAVRVVLEHKAWAGIAGIVGILALIATVVFAPSDEPAPTNEVNNGQCVAQGSGNTVICAGGGAASPPPVVDTAALDELENGSTVQHFVAALGEPTSRRHDPEGSTVWSWSTELWHVVARVDELETVTGYSLYAYSPELTPEIPIAGGRLNASTFASIDPSPGRATTTLDTTSMSLQVYANTTNPLYVENYYVANPYYSHVSVSLGGSPSREHPIPDQLEDLISDGDIYGFDCGGDDCADAPDVLDEWRNRAQPAGFSVGDMSGTSA